MLLLATACASGKPTSNDASETDSSSDATNAADSGSDTGDAPGEAKIYVVGGKSDDPFWSRVKRGAEDAGKVVKTRAGV